MAIKRKFPPRVATVYCSGGCRAKKDEDGALLCAYGCIGCGLCVKKCPYGALSVDRQTKQWRVSDRRCRECGLCAAACPKHCLSLDNSVV